MTAPLFFLNYKSELIEINDGSCVHIFIVSDHTGVSAHILVWIAQFDQIFQNYLRQQTLALVLHHFIDLHLVLFHFNLGEKYELFG